MLQHNSKCQFGFWWLWYLLFFSATPFIEEFPYTADDEEPVYNDDEFFFDCLGSGNEREVTWYQDGVAIEAGEDFIDAGSGLVTGDYEFQQTQAYRRKYNWKSPPASCNNVAKYNGQYKCTVKATAGDVESETSNTFNLKTQCK